MTLAAALTPPDSTVAAQLTLMHEMRKEPQSPGPLCRTTVGPRSGSRLLLVVDQFEELFTLCTDARKSSALMWTTCSAGRAPEAP